MSTAEGTELAEVADLLAPAEGEKTVTIEGKSVKIKKITVGELADILKVAKDSQLEQNIWLVYKCLVSPKLTVEQIRKMSHKTLLQLVWEISKFSELDRESLAKLENFFRTKS